MRVELLDSMGDDLAIVNAARVSYAKESKWAWSHVDQPSFAHEIVVWTDSIIHGCIECGADIEKVLIDSDRGLLNYLMKNRHGTPFEMVQLKFRVHVPIGVAREWQRHRIGSFNEMSTRYVEMEPEFYVPLTSAVRGQVGKPGHYKFETLDTNTATIVQAVMNKSYEESFATYKELLHLGVAKELARNVLPLGLYTEFIWSVNLRSLFNFMSLRTAPDALYEIRVPAKIVEGLTYEVTPVAMKLWDENGRLSV